MANGWLRKASLWLLLLAASASPAFGQARGFPPNGDVNTVQTPLPPDYPPAMGPNPAQFRVGSDAAGNPATEYLFEANGTLYHVLFDGDRNLTDFGPAAGPSVVTGSAYAYRYTAGQKAANGRVATLFYIGGQFFGGVKEVSTGRTVYFRQGNRQYLPSPLYGAYLPLYSPGDGQDDLQNYTDFYLFND